MTRYKIKWGPHGIGYTADPNGEWLRYDEAAYGEKACGQPGGRDCMCWIGGRGEEKHMTSEEFAKKITTTNTFWPAEWATVYLDGCKQLAKDYLALLKTLEKSSSLFATGAVLHRKEVAGLEEELRTLREQVKKQKPVEWEERYFSKEQARDVFGGPLALQAAIPHSGVEVSSCKFNSELWTVRWPKERT